jgi:hypothetical protein
MPLLKCRCRWHDNIKIDFTDKGLEVVDWICIQLAQGGDESRSPVSTMNQYAIYVRLS